jgi:hypothetical protein
MKTKIYFVFATMIAFIACKKNNENTENLTSKNIVKEWINEQGKTSIIKESISFNDVIPSTLNLDWDSQTSFQKNNRNFIEIAYTYGDRKTKSDRYLVVELKNDKVLSAKIKHISLISYLNNTYFAEYWYDATGKLSELWQLNDDRKFAKLDLSTFNNSSSASKMTSSCYQMSGTYWTYSYLTVGDGIVATLHTYYYTLCFYGGNGSQDTEFSDFGGGGGSGGSGGSGGDPNADVITEQLDKDCLKDAFNTIQNTQNIGGPLMQNLKNVLGNSRVVFNWNNANLGSSDPNLYSNPVSDGNGGFNITLNNSILTSSSKEFITAAILNSYFQGYTAEKGNSWANNLSTLSSAMNALASGIRQLHSSLPFGAEYAIALKAFFDGNGSMLNQTQLAINLNQYYAGLVNNGKIPMVGTPNTPSYQPAPDYDGWQVAKDNVGSTYVNATNGTTVICN